MENRNYLDNKSNLIAMLIVIGILSTAAILMLYFVPTALRANAPTVIGFSDILVIRLCPFILLPPFTQSPYLVVLQAVGTISISDTPSQPKTTYDSNYELNLPD